MAPNESLMLADKSTQASQPADTIPPPKSDGYIPTIDALRAVAALAVCWFHFTNAQFVEQFGAYQASGKYGWLGVEMFFVISGFIIPFSMSRAGYRIDSFFTFLLKRITRLDPPYLASIFIVVCGYWLSSTLQGRPTYHIPWNQVLAHLAYLNAFIGLPWLQMSYWSLAIEFQYYIFVGICFPLLALKHRFAPVLILGLFAVMGHLAGESRAFLPRYLPLFAMGILAFRHRCLKVRPYDTFLALTAALALAIWVDGWLEAVAAILSCLAILFLKVNIPWLNALGAISYSIYLIHAFVGNTVFGLALRLAPRMPALKWILPFIAVAITLAGAYTLFRLVELPSRRLAARFQYRTAAERGNC